MTQFLARAVEEACDSLSIDVNYKVSSVAKRSEGLGTANAEDGSKGAVTLVDFWSYKGNEKKAVVYIDPYGGPLVWNITSRWHGYQDVAGTLSRALAQIFYVTWPKEEQDVFLLDLAEILHKTAPTSADPLGINFKVGIARGFEMDEGVINGNIGSSWITWLRKTLLHGTKFCLRQYDPIRSCTVLREIREARIKPKSS
ncbi:hypothetical protein BSL78_13301 [Apostichopus japonicus]|uniref:Uncharacterized protein n=1 Tax=Stichopus japonicus TaxID=307972 RepID=A0A2G8KP58_STIJA|nr:hypothetical protein BSL78_13301 [Apostichopus japonicus]